MKKYLITILFALMIAGTHAQIMDAFKGVLPVTDKSDVVSLNGTWKFMLIRGLDYSRCGDFYQNSYDDSSWNTIHVPANWDAIGLTEPKYGSPDSLTGLHRTTFIVPRQWKGQHTFLRFDGVLYGYDVWVNGKYAGKWESAFNTCLFDVTRFVDYDTVNTLAVRVYTKCKGSDFDCNDDWAPVGIFRDVTMFPIPDLHFSDITIRTDQLGRNSATVSYDLKISSFDKQKIRNANVEASIFDKEGRKVGTFNIPIKDTVTMHKELVFTDPHLWTAETPYLYNLELTLYSGNKSIQRVTKKFGIRKTTIEGRVFKLNGIAFKIHGVTFHSTDPMTGKVISEASLKKDLKMMKAANVNYIRTSHYPQPPIFYDLCDSLGMYVIDEVPFGYGDKNLSDSTYQDILLTRAKATVERDKNHPCVIVWSIGNENPLTPISEVTGQYVKKIDLSRPICYPMVGSYFAKRNFDMPSFIDIYSPHYPSADKITQYDKKTTKPMIFTEYSHSLGQSFEDHKPRWEAMYAATAVTGGSVWEWVDQGMPFKAKRTDFYQWTDSVWTSTEGGFMMCGNKGTDGILYADRTPLPNYYELQRNYAQAQVVDSVFTIASDNRSIPITIRNRYDFINLKNNIRFNWFLTADNDTIQNGTFTTDCMPHDLVTYNIKLNADRIPSQKLMMLHVDVINHDGLKLNNQVLMMSGNSSVTERLLSSGVGSASPFDYIQRGPLMRVGRKSTIAEDITTKGKRLTKYLMDIKSKDKSHYVYENDSIKISGIVNCTKYKKTVKVDYKLIPEKSKNLLLETGLAFLLDKNLSKVQWIGYGPYASYPGKMCSNSYGFHSMQEGDLYFEGNRMGVDAAIVTDDNGNGIMIICKDGKINFEQTDKGIVLTYNSYVSGLGPKSGLTHYAVYADKLKEISGSFYLCKINSMDILKLKGLFVNPQQVKKVFNPFRSQYDTYLLKFNNILSE